MSGDQIVYEQKKEFGERLVNGEWKRMESTNREQTQAQCKQRVIAECQMNYLLLLYVHQPFTLHLLTAHSVFVLLSSGKEESGSNAFLFKKILTY